MVSEEEANHCVRRGEYFGDPTHASGTLSRSRLRKKCAGKGVSSADKVLDFAENRGASEEAQAHG